MASGRRWRGCVAQPFDRDRTACSALWPTTADRRTPSSASHQHGRRGHSSRDRPHLVSACPRTDEAEAVSPFCDVRHAQRGVRGWRRANSISAQCRRDSPRRPLWTPRPHQPRRRSPTGLRRLCAPRQTSRTRRVPSQAREPNSATARVPFFPDQGVTRRSFTHQITCRCPMGFNGRPSRPRTEQFQSSGTPTQPVVIPAASRGVSAPARGALNMPELATSPTSRMTHWPAEPGRTSGPVVLLHPLRQLGFTG